MDAMIPASQVEQMIAEAVAKAVAEAVAKAVVPLQAALAQAKQTIAMLQTKIYGVRSEASKVVLTAEGQQFIELDLKLSQDKTPPPPPLVEVEVKAVRKPRDQRGLAQRFPQLAVNEVEAPLPPELDEQVKAGTLIARRSGRHHDELVVPETKPFVRRVHEMELAKAGDDRPLIQIGVERIVPGGDLADETIHGLAVAKYLDAIPFFRSLTRLDRLGVVIPKQTVNDGMNAWGDLFAPMSQAIQQQVLASSLVHADASWQRLQAKESCERVNLWTVLGGGQVAYRLTENEQHARAAELIPPTFTGDLLTDAWLGWFKLNLGERHGLCNAHARRPFADWLKRNPDNTSAKAIVTFYAELARLEHEADAGPPESLLDRRRDIRREQSRAVMNRIKAEAERTAGAYPDKHQLAEGARYIINHWEGLTRFLDRPELPTDNNAAENALRISALIRKNSLFIGSLAAGHRDATALTVLHSCRLQRLPPADYLAEVTPKLLLHRRGRTQDLAALTPGAIASARRANRGA